MTGLAGRSSTWSPQREIPRRLAPPSGAMSRGRRLLVVVVRGGAALAIDVGDRKSLTMLDPSIVTGAQPDEVESAAAGKVRATSGEVEERTRRESCLPSSHGRRLR